MPKKPTQEELAAKDKELRPKDILEATINEMHDDELEQRLIDAGVAVKV